MTRPRLTSSGTRHQRILTGGLAGAVYGMAGIPIRWVSVVHGRVPGFADREWRPGDLQELAALDDPLQRKASTTKKVVYHPDDIYVLSGKLYIRDNADEVKDNPETRVITYQLTTRVLHARSGTLLWLGALLGLWTTGSFIETIRDILRRAYGVRATGSFWEYRLGSIGLIIASVMLMLIAFSASILLTGIEQFIRKLVPGAGDVLGLITLLHVVPGLVLFGSIYFVFVSLTPRKYRRLQCRKWPGAAFVAAWWLATTALLPVVLSHVGSYDLTYGSLASVIIALIFFFVIGLGVVIGAQLNAALAEPPEPTVKEAKQELAAEKAVAAAEGEPT